MFFIIENIVRFLYRNAEVTHDQVILIQQRFSAYFPKSRVFNRDFFYSARLRINHKPGYDSIVFE
jgi:hypothetical protein